jgi:hypothetical protein
MREVRQFDVETRRTPVRAVPEVENGVHNRALAWQYPDLEAELAHGLVADWSSLRAWVAWVRA